MTYRFIHAADIHLDSPLRSLALRNHELATLVGNATRRAFEHIIDLALSERVNALLIAGDLYDGDQTSMKTARFLAEQLRRLDQAGIDVFIIRGNHDALSKITKELILPERVQIFDRKACAITVTAPDHAQPVVFHGLSFAKPHAPDSLLPQYSLPVSGAVNIGLMHTSLNGAEGHDLYAPVSVSDLQSHGFHYWALGHIHKRAVYAPTSQYNSTVVMAGNPQGRDINEAGAKSVTLVTIDDSGTVHTEERLTSIAQFERVSVDVSACEDWRVVIQVVNEALEAKREATASEHLVARLHLTGSTALAWQMRRDHDLLLTEAEDRAAQIGDCWIEKLEIDCTPPRKNQPSDTMLTADPLQELGRLITDELAASPVYQSGLADQMDALVKKLPAEIRSHFGNDEAQAQALIADLLQRGSEDVLAELSAVARAATQTEEQA